MHGVSIFNNLAYSFFQIFFALKKIKTALISVYYKTGIDTVVSLLKEQCVQIYSTGGTYDYIRNLDPTVKTVESLTTYPSILGGRVKTLHPKVFGDRPDVVVDIDGGTYGVISVANFSAIGQTYRFKGNKAHAQEGKKDKYADALTAACFFSVFFSY